MKKRCTKKQCMYLDIEYDTRKKTFYLNTNANKQVISNIVVAIISKYQNENFSSLATRDDHNTKIFEIDIQIDLTHHVFSDRLFSLSTNGSKETTLIILSLLLSRLFYSKSPMEIREFDSIGLEIN